MKPIITGALAAVAVLGLVSACSDDSKPTTSGPGATVAAGETLPGGEPAPTVLPGFTIPPGQTLPSDFTVPSAAIDQLVTQFEATGMTVDRPCIENLLKGDVLRELVAAQGTPSADLIARFTACFKP